MKAFRQSIVVALLGVSLSGCSDVNRRNYDKIRYGMNQNDVESILGKPTAASEFGAEEFSLEKVREYEWECLVRVIRFAPTAELRIWGKKYKYIQVLFMDDEVIAKRQEGL